LQRDHLLAVLEGLPGGPPVATKVDDVSRAAWPYSGKVVRGAPKSRAGVRVLSLPRPIADLLAVHLVERVGPDDVALVFTGDKGGPMSRNNFNKRVNWPKQVEAIGVPGLHLHDLRHTGNTLAAMTGASLRDLMIRMGHDSMRAALIYQHKTQGADRKIADALGGLIERHEKDAKKDLDSPDGKPDEPDPPTAE
jgi:integrase